MNTLKSILSHQMNSVSGMRPSPTVQRNTEDSKRQDAVAHSTRQTAAGAPESSASLQCTDRPRLTKQTRLLEAFNKSTNSVSESDKLSLLSVFQIVGHDQLIEINLVTQNKNQNKM